MNTENGTADLVNLDAYTAQAPQPAKPKRISRKKAQELKDAYNMGHAEAMEQFDTGGQFIGTCAFAVITFALGVGLGAWLF